MNETGGANRIKPRDVGSQSAPEAMKYLNIFAIMQRQTMVRMVDVLMAVRAVTFMGRRFTCPVCGWRLRGFTHGGASLRSRPRGYCPRCNSKARHRRIWLFLEEHTNLFRSELSLLHISPKYSLSRRFVRMRNLNYVAGDIGNRPNVDVRLNVSQLPFASEAFDAIICVHVLEHVEHDRAAMQEMQRVLKPGGWAVISVPIRLDQTTYEDASIRTPSERKLAFGESTHVRYYGHDIVERLEDAGFEVTLDLADSVSQPVKDRFGLLDDENILFCRKPTGARVS